MPAPKKSAINTELSRLIATNPSFAKDVKKYMVKYKAKPTTTNAAKTKLLATKKNVDMGKAYTKGGKELEAKGYKSSDSTGLSAQQRLDKINQGEKLQRIGRYVSVRAAQPYGEASRTNARVQARAKKKSK